MAIKSRSKFNTIGECLESSQGLNSIFNQINELLRISELIYAKFPQLRDFCHCGAIDYPNDMLVLYTSNNSSFHQVNNLVPLIQEYLDLKGVSFQRLLVKSRPQNSKEKPKTKKELIGEKEQMMLNKFAEAIKRPDLIKSAKKSNTEVQESPDDEWNIEL